MNNVFAGKGLTINRQSKQQDNLYKPTSSYIPESYNYVHANDVLNKKFAPLIIKEWFFLIKPSGYLIIDYGWQGSISFDEIEHLCWWLFKGNYSIISHQKLDKNITRFIIQKKDSCFVNGDSIEKWTFGIITNGDRNEWVEEIIQSIHKQHIPSYEIIVCGKYKERKEKNVTYIPFNERSEKGWITRKKNIICENAQYENLSILHDRLVLDDNWYIGMKQYGNAFELLGCKQIDKETNQPAGDWLTMNGPIGTKYKISQLQYNDWNYFSYLSGQLTIIKKSIWKQILWDECRYWDQEEDVDLSFRARDRGYLVRFNPYSTVFALAWRHGKLPLQYNIHDGIFPKDMIGRRIMRIGARIVTHIPYIHPVIGKLSHTIMQSKLYKKLIYN